MQLFDPVTNAIQTVASSPYKNMLSDLVVLDDSTVVAMNQVGNNYNLKNSLG